jgi:phosphinothricin acetyltransferase
MNANLKIRQAEPEDAARLVEIYAPYITDTAVSFEYKVPSVEEFQNRIRHIKEKYPYLICEKDGKIVGYAYASAYSSREAYDWTAVSSIYVDRQCHRQGVGALLYKELEESLRKQGIVNLLAGVAYIETEDKYLTKDSYNFHTKIGYEKVAHMKAIGKKFDRWYDLIWLQKKL